MRESRREIFSERGSEGRLNRVWKWKEGNYRIRGDTKILFFVLKEACEAVGTQTLSRRI